MNLRVLCLLAGTISLAGCATQAAQAPPTPTPAAVPSAAATTGATTIPAAVTGPTAPIIASGDPYRTGITLLRRRQYASAVSQFKRALAAHKDTAKAYAGLAAAEAGQGKFSQAVTDYKKASSLDPSNQSYLYGAAYAALYANQFRQTVTYTTTLLNRNPKNVAAYHLQMLAYGRLFMPKGGLYDAQHIAKLQPKSAEAFDDLGIALANTKHYKAALKAFGHAIAIAPHYNYYSNRAVVENLLKERSLAIKDFRRAGALAPTKAEKKLMATAVAGVQKTK